MKIEVWKPKDVVKPEKVLRLKLVKDSNTGEADLVAVGEDGICFDYGCIASITPSGKLCLTPGIRNDLGLQLDSEGRIKVVGKGS